MKKIRLNLTLDSRYIKYNLMVSFYCFLIKFLKIRRCRYMSSYQPDKLPLFSSSFPLIRHRIVPQRWEKALLRWVSQLFLSQLSNVIYTLANPCPITCMQPDTIHHKWTRLFDNIPSFHLTRAGVLRKHTRSMQIFEIKQILIN